MIQPEHPGTRLLVTALERSAAFVEKTVSIDDAANPVETACAMASPYGEFLETSMDLLEPKPAETLKCVISSAIIQCEKELFRAETANGEHGNDAAKRTWEAIGMARDAFAKEQGATARIAWEAAMKPFRNRQELTGDELNKLFDAIARALAQLSLETAENAT